MRKFESKRASRFAVYALAVVCAGMFGFTGVAHGAVIFTDTFDSGTGDWYRANTTGAGPLTNSSGQLSWTRSNDSSREVIGRSFDTTSIGVGETIRLSFDYRQTIESASIFRAGLFNVTNPIVADDWAASGAIGSWSGYYTFVRDNVATGNIARRESAASASGALYPSVGGTSLFTDTTTYDINQDGTITYQGVFEVTRTSLTDISTLFTLSSGNITHFSIPATTTTVQDNFNTAVLRVAGGTALFDNIQVSVIPEPSTVAILASGIALLGFRVARRRASRS